MNESGDGGDFMNESGEDYDEQRVAENALSAKQAESARLKSLRGKVRLEKADNIIKSNVIQAVALGLIPIPVLDVLALTNIQFKMMDDLIRLYNVHYTKMGRSVVRAFILGVLPIAAVAGMSSMLKIIPGIGTLVGSASVSVSSGGLTYAVGMAFVRHFERGGTLDDFNLEEAKRQLRKNFAQDRKTVQTLIEHERLSG